MQKDKVWRPILKPAAARVMEESVKNMENSLFK
jgi:hypothetical protein